MKLPIDFEHRMKEQLGPDFQDFLESYDHEAYRGIRVNTLKISVEDFLAISPFDLEPIPWTKDGFYIKDRRPAKHPHYFAGLYYIQEPSAMLPAVVLAPTSEDIALDLCAAPGGKTMQMAAMMNNEGLLIANDINNHRLKALMRNAELMGVKNLVVFNDRQENIRRALKGKIDKLLIDAPCSGEGMFKKDEDAILAYASYDIDACVRMQKAILDDILEVLNEEGELVYSTCTFNTFENEDMVFYAQDRKDMTLVDIPKNHGFVSGGIIESVARIYPHRVKGEGHFTAKLKMNGSRNTISKKNMTSERPDLLRQFMAEILVKPLEGRFKVVKNKVFMMPENMIDISGVKIIKDGWYIGELKKNRFEPSHAFALGLKASNCKHVINFASDSSEIIKYLKCETIACEGNKGYNLICVDGYPVGWGKWNNGKLKNLYPAQWRLS